MMATIEPEYMSVTEVARALRKRLKTAFPDTKFSVRSSRYSMGASIDVSWTDGPIVHDVDEICEPLQGADFDGMQDMKTYRDPIGIDGRYVRSGADYIITQRSLSDPYRAELEHLACSYLEIEELRPNDDYVIAGLPTVCGSSFGFEIARKLAERPNVIDQMRDAIANRTTTDQEPA